MRSLLISTAIILFLGLGGRVLYQGFEALTAPGGGAMAGLRALIGAPA